MLPTPQPYLDRYTSQSPQPPWKKILFNPGVSLQSAEANELQSILTYNFQCLADSIYQEGAWIYGGNITTTTAESAITVNIAAGRLYAYGYFHDIPAGTCAITGVGTETVSLVISEQVNTVIQDPTLSDPAVGSENFGKPGADRLLFTYAYALNVSTGIVVATFINGQLQITTTTNNFLDQILALLALRTYETSGSFVAAAPSLSIADTASATTNPVQMQLTVSG